MIGAATSLAFCATRVFRRATHSRPSLSRSEEHTSELQPRLHLVCRLLLEKKKTLAPFAEPPTSLVLTRAGDPPTLTRSFPESPTCCAMSGLPGVVTVTLRTYHRVQSVPGCLSRRGRRKRP